MRFPTDMKITCFTGGMVQTNGYLLETNDGNLLIDAPEGVDEWLEEKGLSVDALLLTHQHYDHVTDAAALQKKGIKVHAFSPYSSALTLEEAARAWGMPIAIKSFDVDSRIDVSAPLKICGIEIHCRHVPGHSTDSVTFYLPQENVLFAGDTLFAGSIGRTDLPEGSTTQLIEGIRRHLLTLPPQTTVLSGHGPQTTIGNELAHNPFLT
jgi:glyoxylase-like metal-dependent hydrolase (beta-lactamase superfamily II)